VKDPTNLEECLQYLDEFFTSEDKKTIRGLDEKNFSAISHHGMGQEMRNKWGLWKGSELQDFFKKMGLWHADDMSDIILTSYHRHLTGKPLDVEAQVEAYKEYWKKIDDNPDNVPHE
jgi:hypothetical protein